MPQQEGPDKRNLPLGLVTLVFGALSVPLAFARHLVSLALVLAVLAVLFGVVGRLLVHRRPGVYGSGSIQRGRWATWLAVLGLVLSVVIWILWARDVLPFLPGK